MAASLMPVPKQHYTGFGGHDLAGGKVYTYAAGTNNPKDTYTDQAGTIPQANPIVLNSRGEPESAIYWNGAYKVEVKDDLGNLIYTVDNFVTDPYGYGNILATLALPTGSTLIGTQNTFPGAVARGLDDKLNDLISATDAGADVGGGDDLAAINAVINAVKPRSYLLPQGDYRLSLDPTNPQGAKPWGNGRLLQTKTLHSQNFDYQVNSYTEQNKLSFGKEYLYWAYFRLYSFVQTSALSTLNVQLYGDSTVQGTAEITAPYQLATLVPALFRARGVSNVSVTNLGVSGTKVGDMPTGSIAAGTDLIFIKYGINDAADVFTMGFDAALNQFTTNLRSKLSTIRAARQVSGLSIVLVAPNSTYAEFGQNTPWYEAIRNVYEQAARDYDCAYFDTYAYLKDTRKAANLWMDQVYPGEQATIHPRDMMQSWIWAGMLDALFPKADLAQIVGGNRFTNLGAIGETSLAAAVPTDYHYGQSVKRATPANGWPVDGLVTTMRGIDNIAVQVNVTATNNNYPQTKTRTNQSAGASWTGWTGDEVALSLQNGWVIFDANWSQPGAYLSGDGFTCYLKGLIKSGTVTAGTLLFTLPAGMRPAKITTGNVCFSGGTMGQIQIATNGQVTALTALNATFTSLDGVSFRVA